MSLVSTSNDNINITLNGLDWKACINTDINTKSNSCKLKPMAIQVDHYGKTKQPFIVPCIPYASSQPDWPECLKVTQNEPCSNSAVMIDLLSPELISINRMTNGKQSVKVRLSQDMRCYCISKNYFVSGGRSTVDVIEYGTVKPSNTCSSSTSEDAVKHWNVALPACSAITCLAIWEGRNDQHLLAIGCNTSSVMLYDLKARNVLIGTEWTVHLGKITCLAFAEWMRNGVEDDMRGDVWLYSASLDNRVIRWNLKQPSKWTVIDGKY